MENKTYIISGLCGLALFSGFSDAAQIKLQKAGGSSAENLVGLTLGGTRLEAEYTAILNALCEELRKEIPAVDDSKKAALIALLKAELGSAKQHEGVEKALRNSRASEDNYTALVEKPVAVHHAWGKCPIGNPKCNGDQDIPLTSFRTDQWDLPEEEDPALKPISREVEIQRKDDAVARLEFRRTEEAKHALDTLGRLKTLGK